MPWDQPFDALTEFLKAYTETYVRINHNDRKTVVLVHGQSLNFCPTGKQKQNMNITGWVPSHDPYIIAVSNRTYGLFEIRFQEHGLRIDGEYPTTGYFLHRGRLFYFYRLSRRQWMKGLCEATAVAVECGGVGKVQLTSALLESAYQTITPISLTEGISWLQTPDFIGIPLSKFWGLSNSWDHSRPDDYVLWYKNVPVAWVGAWGIKQDHPGITQELNDFLVANSKLEKLTWKLNEAGLRRLLGD